MLETLHQIWPILAIAAVLFILGYWPDKKEKEK